MMRLCIEHRWLGWIWASCAARCYGCVRLAQLAYGLDNANKPKINVAENCRQLVAGRFHPGAVVEFAVVRFADAG